MVINNVYEVFSPMTKPAQDNPFCRQVEHKVPEKKIENRCGVYSKGSLVESDGGMVGLGVYVRNLLPVKSQKIIPKVQSTIPNTSLFFFRDR